MMRRSSGLAALGLVLGCGGDGERGDTTTGATASQASISISGAPSTDPTGGATGDETASDPVTTTATTAASMMITGESGESGEPPKFDLGGSEATTGVDETCPCAPKLDLIYVLSDERELWTYDPEQNVFAMVGALGCPTSDGTFSMGVGRDGKAWIQTTTSQGQGNVGDLFVLDVNDPANCSDPGYTPGANGWQQFGMGFVSNSMADPCDRLYGQHWDGSPGGFSEGPNFGKLGVFDPMALQVTTIGATDYNGAELTGTGDGRLYAFGGSPSAKLIQFDKTSAQVLETVPFADFPLTSAFAFAFWGGDFYFFTEGKFPNSKVTKLDYDNSDGGGKALTTVNDAAPILIVGAGVSTCAPVLPPG